MGQQPIAKCWTDTYQNLCHLSPLGSGANLYVFRFGSTPLLNPFLDLALKNLKLCECFKLNISAPRFHEENGFPISTLICCQEGALFNIVDCWVGGGLLPIFRLRESNEKAIALNVG